MNYTELLAAYDKLEAERDALAAQAKNNAAWLKDFDVIMQEFGFEQRISSMPELRQYIRQIQAEAGRSGFISGANWLYASQLDGSVIEDDKVNAANKYADRVKAGN